MINTINLYINNIAYNKIQNIPLINYYLAIKARSYLDSLAFKINDPETAIRLTKYFSKQQLLPYLATPTNFDKQMLINNGLL